MADGNGKRGRPSSYTEKLGQEICMRLASGESLRSICRDEHMPDERRVREWALNLQHPFSPQYARAREIAYHSMADELFEIADDGSNDWMERNDKDNPGYEANGEHMQRSRLRVDTRKWMLSRMLPKLYGDKVHVESDNKHHHTVDAVSAFDEFLAEASGARAAGDTEKPLQN